MSGWVVGIWGTKFPCKDCAERHYKCHVTCERYIEASMKNKEVKTQKVEALMIDEYVSRRMLKEKYK